MRSAGAVSAPGASGWQLGAASLCLRGLVITVICSSGVLGLSPRAVQAHWARRRWE
ncbi:hypothetical protein [Streptomyces telluris]|uniref:Uncharacterized protein n=1 Tax=Streptomyces telluris TaxID=2720021 RepID=A0A9X2LLM0_9ACTN|nr:hypothetical protein [Streptomyces telluris]MCQ8773092.1 hypothetical protein [Streptomyces telluris]NJP81844.1 hypothetical protein [Streptomyces telluris]